jgi:hypothetical protein
MRSALRLIQVWLGRRITQPMNARAKAQTSMACATTMPIKSSRVRLSLSTIETQYPFHDIIEAEHGNEEDEGRPDRR